MGIIKRDDIDVPCAYMVVDKGGRERPCRRGQNVIENGESWCHAHAPSATLNRMKKNEGRYLSKLDQEYRARREELMFRRIAYVAMEVVRGKSDMGKLFSVVAAYDTLHRKGGFNLTMRRNKLTKIDL